MRPALITGTVLSPMELRHLRYFVTVAHRAPLRARRRRLFISQPGLSRQIRSLEGELRLEFRSNNAVHQPLIDALKLLKRYANSSQRLYPAREKVPLGGVVPPAIEELVVRNDAKGKQRVDRINYEICVLRAFREHLRCKEVWVVGADRYRNPDEDLPEDFDVKRESYYDDLGQPHDV